MALGQNKSLTGGDYFTDFHTNQSTPSAATAVRVGWSLTNCSFMLRNFGL
jgi:hypothetical protein